MKRRALKLLLALAGLGLVGLAGAIAWLTFTQSGLDFAVAQAESLVPVHLRIQGARGRLAGPLAIHRFEFANERVEVVVTDLQADYEPSSLAWGSIAADALAARSIVVRVKPRLEPDTQPPRFLPGWLHVSIDEITVAQVDLTLPDGRQLPLSALHGSLRLSSSRLEASGISVDGDGWAVAGGFALNARDPLGLEGRVDFRAGPADDLRGSVTFTGDLAALEATGTLAAPLAADFGVRLASLEERPHWQARLDVKRLETSRLAGLEFLGPLAGSLEGSGTFADYRLAGTLRGRGLPAEGAVFRFDAGLVPDAIDIRTAEIRLPDTGANLSLAGRIGLAQPLSIDLAANWTRLAWPLAGPAQVTSREGRLQIRGGPQYDWRLSAAATPRGLPEFGATASGRIDASGLAVARADLTGLGGRGRASGRLGFGETRAWQFSADLAGLDPGRVRPDLSGRISGVIDGSGEGLGEEASWQVGLRSLRGTFRRQPVSGHADIRHRPGVTTFERTEIAIGPATLAIAGRIGGDTALDARLEARDLSRLLPELGGSVHASLQARSRPSARGAGPALGMQVTLVGDDLRLDDYRIARLAADADIDLGDRDPSWVRIRTIGIDLAGRKLSSTRLSFDGTSHDHSVTLRAGLSEDAIEVLGRGSLAWPAYSLRVTSVEARGPRAPDYALAGPFDVALRRGEVSVSPACFRHGDQRICAEGGWSATRPWLAALTVEALPLAVRDLHLPGRPAYRGRLDAQAAMAGAPGQEWRASGVAQVTGATVSYVTENGREEVSQVGTARLELAGTPQSWLLRLVSQATEATLIEAEVAAPRIESRALADLPISGRLRVSTGALGLVPLFVPDIDRVRGTVHADLALAGTARAPTFAGKASLEGGELDFYQSNLRLRGLEATATFADNRVTLATHATAGQGSFTLGGYLAWQEGGVNGDLELHGERLLVADLPEARVVASPDLRFRFDASRALVTGTVLVPEARIAPAKITGAVFASADQRIVGTPAAETRQSRYALNSQITLTLGKDVHIDAFGLKARITGSVKASLGSDDVATGSGEFKIESGKYSAYTKELEIEHGRLLFAGGPLSDPGVDLRAQRDFPGYVAGINVRGRLRQPELTLFSDPSMSQTEIASLLIVGRRLESVGSSDSKQFKTSSSDLATQGGALLAGQLGRYVGLDNVGVETGPDDASSLVIGKFLSPRLYVSYGLSLSQQINTLKLRYKVGDRWRVNLESGTASSLEIEYTIDR